VSTFAGSNSGLVSFSTPLQENIALHHVNPKAPGPLRLLAERVGRDLVSNAQLLNRRGIFERESWTSKAAIALRQASDDLHFGSNLSGVPVHAGLYHPAANLWR
jgi:hypothetical protein